VPGPSEALNELWSLHYKLRFDPQGLEQDRRQVLRSGVREWIQASTRAKR